MASSVLLRFGCILCLAGSVGSARAVPLSGGAGSASAEASITKQPSTVSFGVWVGALTDLLDSIPAPGVDAQYRAFIVEHRLSSSDTLERDYRRMRLLFEALRDGGFWHLRWAVTDRYPSSRAIWRQWIREVVKTGFGEPSATAECDELSALQGMLARHTNVRSVGLYYPTWNHTIAVWAPLEGKAKTGLIQLPTTQIFLDCDAGFDRTTFVTSLENIERYPNLDLRATDRLPEARADWLLQQIRTYAQADPDLWSLIRAKRAFAMGSSMGACQEARERWYLRLHDHLSAGDQRALGVLARDELDRAHATPEETLAWLLR